MARGLRNELPIVKLRLLIEIKPISYVPLYNKRNLHELTTVKVGGEEEGKRYIRKRVLTWCCQPCQMLTAALVLKMVFLSFYPCEFLFPAILFIVLTRPCFCVLAWSVIRHISPHWVIRRPRDTLHRVSVARYDNPTHVFLFYRTADILPSSSCSVH